MFGCEQVAARLDFFVVGRGSETGASCGPSVLQCESSGCILSAGVWLEALQAVHRLVVALESWMGNEAPLPTQAAR
eukprot:3733131-Pyramimonas_sp.AAC.1